MSVAELPVSTLDPARASRAIGAMFYGAFGGAWAAIWAWRSFAARTAAVAFVALFTCRLVAFLYRQYRRFSSGQPPEPETPAKRRQDRWFHAINAGQWIVILVVGNVLANIGLAAWVIPAAMFIVGLHFLPLARLFGNPKHLATGGALMLLAATYPFFDPAGPASATGALGAALILWASAFWAVA